MNNNHLGQESNPIQYHDDSEPDKAIHISRSKISKKNIIILSVFLLLTIVLLTFLGNLLYKSFFKNKESYTNESIKLTKVEEDHTIDEQKKEILSEQASQELQVQPEAASFAPSLQATPQIQPSMPHKVRTPVVYNYGMLDFNKETTSVSQEGDNGQALAKTTKYPTSKAQLDKVNPTYRLGKGKSILCTLQTKIDTSQPGMVTCVVAKDVYSDDGKMVLIDKGSMVIGEQTQGLTGTNRAFVAWSEIRTPNNINITIDSPMSDSLGAPGINGKINKQFLRKFFVGTLISIIQSVENYGLVKKSKQNEISIDPSNVEGMIESMTDTLVEKEVLVVNPGTPVSIQLMRDLDFSEVYE